MAKSASRRPRVVTTPDGPIVLTDPELPGQQSVSTGSPIDFDYGSRRMRAYPLSELDLKDLARIGSEAAICFSLAGAAFGFAVNLVKDLSIATGVSSEVAATWGTIRTVCFIASAGFALAGIYLFATGHRRVEDIKRQTSFANDGANAAQSWSGPRFVRLGVAAGGVVLAFLIGRYLG